MKIISVNKYYQLTGGGDRFFFDSNAILENNGHVVVPFCLGYKGNKPSPFSRYFPVGVAGSEIVAVGFLQKIKLFINGIYSFPARRAIKALIKDEHPDVAHLHILHYTMSPSVIDELHAQNVPIVFSLHDYRIGCAGGYLYRNDRPCSLCAPNRFFSAVVHSCYQGSRSASLMGMLGNYLYQLRGVYKKVDAFTVPHQAMKDLVMQFGIPNEKIHVLPNPFLDANAASVSRSQPLGDYVLYFGNLSAQKGVFTLLKAAMQIPDIKFMICGTGAALKELEAEIELGGASNITVDTTSRWHSGLQELISGARMVISPSEWPTPLEYSTLEAMSMGKAVIASDMGGNREVIIDGETGILFQSGDVTDLVGKIRSTYDDPVRADLLGSNAADFIRARFTVDSYYEALEPILQKAIQVRGLRK